VQERLYNILTQNCGLGAVNEGETSSIHCEPRRVEEQWIATPALDKLRLESQRAAAAACASVNPLVTEMRTLALGNGGVIYGVETKDSVSPTSPISPTSPTSPSFTISPKRSDSDRGSMMTKTSSRSGGGKTSSGTKARSGNGSVNGPYKTKPKVRAHEAPVYAGSSLLFVLIPNTN
jgi:hypothetical protein